MNREQTGKTLSCWWFILLAASASVSAQNQDINTHISAIKAIFQQLDSAAETCVSSSNANTPLDCQAFITAMDGDSLADYLQHCSVLNGWRDQVVAQNAGSAAAIENSEETLQGMIDVEFTCGDTALLKRTSFVAAAFEITQSPHYLSSQSAISLLNQQRSQSDYNQLRNSTLNNIENGQQRLRLEIQQQWNRIELENIRQQNTRPIDFGSRIQ